MSLHIILKRSTEWTEKTTPPATPSLYFLFFKFVHRDFFSSLPFLIRSSFPLFYSILSSALFIFVCLSFSDHLLLFFISFLYSFFLPSSFILHLFFPVTFFFSFIHSIFLFHPFFPFQTKTIDEAYVKTKGLAFNWLFLHWPHFQYIFFSLLQANERNGFQCKHSDIPAKVIHFNCKAATDSFFSRWLFSVFFFLTKMKLLCTQKAIITRRKYERR